MGATTGNQNKMDAARQLQATEGRSMRRRAIQQQEQGVQPEMAGFPPQAPGRTPVSMGRVPEMRSGIVFGPGRANRLPEQNSPEYQQLLQSIRDMNRKRG